MERLVEDYTAKWGFENVAFKAFCTIYFSAEQCGAPKENDNSTKSYLFFSLLCMKKMVSKS